ncbi:MAG TPA: TonB family protein [Candidatus Dormibacteraeota bacterium]|nr:TonB family protein [Candidatus Dormibacteraeota bacterium]
MALRCFLFSSDEGTSDIIRQVLTGLGVEGESCADATTAVQTVGSQSFQLVVIDWDQQPEASHLLATARERKAAERPLTLAIVSDDASVPKALQAGANSILRRPLTLHQAKDTLTTARDLLRSRSESAERTAQAAAAATSAGAATSLPSNQQAGKESMLRAGEFLQAGPAAPGGQYETESERGHHSGASEIDPLKDLEPVAASVAAKPTPVILPPPPSEPDEPRSLEALLKSRGARRASPAPAAPTPPPSAAPELLGYDQTHSHSGPEAPSESITEAPRHEPEPSSAHQRKKEAELFAYIDGQPAESKGASRFRLGKGAIVFALALAGCAIVAAPQAPWHPRLLIVWARGQRALHAWLNPQPVTTPQAPTTHEDFGRAGDEYKLPVAENIPDATTDPSQIHVLPVVDPTAKKPTDRTSPDQTTAPTDGTADTASDAPKDSAVQPPATQPTATQPVQTTPEVAQPAGGPVTVGISVPPTTTVAPPSTAPAHTDPPAVVAPSPTAKPAPRQPSTYVPLTTKVPSSLQSQMVSMTPDAGGNKPAEAALPAIEPVEVPELTERALLTDQPALAYPANAAGRTGTVVLQVLIGRDGAVQDAKFLQGSLAFARTAIDGAKQWKFKPYTMNGRPVSVQTTLTIKFQPAR